MTLGENLISIHHSFTFIILLDFIISWSAKIDLA